MLSYPSGWWGKGWSVTVVIWHSHGVFCWSFVTLQNLLLPVIDFCFRSFKLFKIILLNCFKTICMENRRSWFPSACFMWWWWVKVVGTSYAYIWSWVNCIKVFKWTLTVYQPTRTKPTLNNEDWMLNLDLTVIYRSVCIKKSQWKESCSWGSPGKSLFAYYGHIAASSRDELLEVTCLIYCPLQLWECRLKSLLWLGRL